MSTVAGYDKVKQAYICLRVTLNWFLNLVTKFNDTNDLSLLATMTLNSVEQVLNLEYTQTSGTPRTPTAPRALPHSTTPNTNNLLVSTLQSMQKKLLNLLLVMGNLSAVRFSSSTADNDDNNNSTGNTDDSILAYLNAGKRLDFYLGRG